MKHRLLEEGSTQTVTKCNQLKLIAEDKQGFVEVEDAAQRGGKVAGNARKETEKELGRPITSKENYNIEPEKKKKLRVRAEGDET